MSGFRFGGVLCLLFLACPGATRAGFTLSHVAGRAEGGFSGDGGPATWAQFDQPEDIAISPDGTLYIADTGNDRIRRVMPDGIVDSLDVEGGPSALNRPRQVAVDAHGNVYVVDGSPSRVRRVRFADGGVDTVLGTALGSYALANDAQGNIFITIAPSARGGPSYLLRLSSGEGPTIEEIRLLGWRSPFVPYRVAAMGPERVALALSDPFAPLNFYGIRDPGIGVSFTYDLEEYALQRPRGLALTSAGTLYFTASSYYGPNAHYLPIRHDCSPEGYVLEQGRRVFNSVGGGGRMEPADGVAADMAALRPCALATRDSESLYVVHFPNQIFALRSGERDRGSITGSIVPGAGANMRTVSIYAFGDRGTSRYTRPDSTGRFQFRGLPPDRYTVRAHFDEEGFSCDARDCGWSGALNDCPNPPLKDPAVLVSGARPRQRVRLRLLHSFPCT